MTGGGERGMRRPTGRCRGGHYTHKAEAQGRPQDWEQKSTSLWQLPGVKGPGMDEDSWN